MEEVFNAQKFDRVTDYIADDMVEHTPGLSAGAAGIRRDFEMVAKAFPDMHTVVKDLIAEGDKVAAHYYWAATHRGEFNGVAATAKQVHVRGLDLWQMHDGKCIAHWNVEDNLGMLQQLGVIPTPE